MPSLDEMLDNIFDSQKPPFRPEFERWIRGSRRFKAFAVTYSSKIRTKLKTVGDESHMDDLRAELETAMLLLREERFTLDYEKYTASKQRGPDFTVTFKTHTPFNVEVRRIRNIELADENDEAYIDKLMAVLCDKVGQMPPNIINMLWLVSNAEISETTLTRVTVALRELAERKVEEFFMRRGFKSAAEFLKQYRQLSGIVLHQLNGTVLWLNPIARHKAPPEIVKALQRLAAAK